MREKIIAGNWKMNKSFEEAEDLIYEITEGIQDMNLRDTSVILCPPFLYLEMAADAITGTRIKLGAQNLHEKDFGAYTGEISAPMLKSLDVEYCIIGHSERRKFFHETGKQLAAKVESAIRNEIHPVFCCGELLDEREKGIQNEIVKSQLEESLFFLESDDFKKVIIAYEPVWAIGTGVNATPEQAQEMHAYIRSLIQEKYGEKIAGKTTILYGGSCNAKNAASLFANPDVDGGLIGGASLDATEFLDIIKQRIQN
ncbi:MAG: triose-phosphate isomerase [Bacteroidetes bacterium]|nr:triose-phosphate isomerase [Bacteroidota bacterium]